MTTIKILLRPSLVSVLVATTALGGCKLSALDLTPPRVIQLSCSSTSATHQAPMVLILDSGRASVVWVNRPSARAGKLEVEANLYRLDFPSIAGAGRLQAVINRYDGRMALSGPGTDVAGAAQPQMSCEVQPVQPKV
ncbi:hypothetical protein [Stenotrophomonas maltophilia]|uniref:hypothetical protein n=1 Tax=Stenotrophomonas maltophilia TaxID=40324 RepID=UPI0029FA503B|nr:hypothetical protein [Stenotrophomonas maltophilia]